MPPHEVAEYSFANDLKFLELFEKIHRILDLDFERIFIMRLLKMVKLHAIDNQNNFKVQLLDENLPTQPSWSLDHKIGHEITTEIGRRLV